MCSKTSTARISIDADAQRILSNREKEIIAEKYSMLNLWHEEAHMNKLKASDMTVGNADLAIAGWEQEDQRVADEAEADHLATRLTDGQVKVQAKAHLARLHVEKREENNKIFGIAPDEDHSTKEDMRSTMKMTKTSLSDKGKV